MTPFADKGNLQPRPASLAAVWVTAVRPFSLTMSVAPVAAGASLSWANAGKLHWGAVIAAGLASAFIQIGTNLYNDAADYLRGAHREDRAGPLNVIAQGLLTAPQIARAAWLSFACAAALGLYLVYAGGWPILILGLLSILCGWGYTGGPLPIAYTPLGEVFVVAFFGLGATGGTYWLCAGRIGLPALIGGLALGSFAAAVLHVNNYRDVREDRRVGRLTLAIAVGPRISRLLYALMLLAPFGMTAYLAALMPQTHVWAALVTLPFASHLINRFYRELPGPGLTGVLKDTVKLQVLFTAALCAGVLL